MRHLPTALAALVLTACQPQAPDKNTTPPPADAPPAQPSAAGMDISQPIRAVGNEPFWGLTVTDGTKITLTRPDKPDLVATAPGAALQPGRATLVAMAADGRQVTVVLYASECSDGMSDRKYPMSAEVALLNETLRGCADKASEFQKGSAP